MHDPVFVLHPSMFLNLSRELDRCCIATYEMQEDGVRVIHIQEVPHPEKLTVEQRGLLGLVDGLRIVEMAKLPSMIPESRKVNVRGPEGHMAQLRRKTGQDWRGRR